jgi:hypothetical protein
MQIADRCAPVKVANSAENPVLQALRLALASPYIASSRTTTQKTHPLPNGCPLLLRIRWNLLTKSLLSNGSMRTHIENTSCNTCSIIACVYRGRCLTMGLLYCWLRICCGLVYRFVAYEWVYASRYYDTVSLILFMSPQLLGGLHT